MSEGKKKKKGLSLEEKRERVLSIFHETADVFILKVPSTLSVNGCCACCG